jgi:hypothetical protein
MQLALLGSPFLDLLGLWLVSGNWAFVLAGNPDIGEHSSFYHITATIISESYCRETGCSSCFYCGPDLPSRNERNAPVDF